MRGEVFLSQQGDECCSGSRLRTMWNAQCPADVSRPVNVIRREVPVIGHITRGLQRGTQSGKFLRGGDDMCGFVHRWTSYLKATTLSFLLGFRGQDSARSVSNSLTPRGLIGKKMM